MAEIILIRPGSTDYDQEERVQGNLDIPLNTQGAAEVTRVIQELAGREIEVVYSPDCEPACETAKVIAAAFGCKRRTLDQMENLDHGLWQGMKIDEIRRKYPRVYKQWQEQPESVCPPEGETLDHAEHRMTAAMAKLLKRHREGTIVLVAPEPMARLVRRFLDHGQLGDLWKAPADHGRWEMFAVNSSVPATGS
ncbi:MAG: histidine phosphatase family protein [Pirellulales bacterium]|nr:histidine phosphatase family protein [Pirellulales bacterium]